MDGNGNGIQLNFNVKYNEKKLDKILNIPDKIDKTITFTIEPNDIFKNIQKDIAALDGQIIHLGLDINQTQLNEVRNIVNELNNVGGNNRGGRGRNGGNGRSRQPAWNQIHGGTYALKEVRSMLEQEIRNGQYVQDLQSKGARNFVTRVQARYNSKGEPEYTGIVNYENAANKATQAILKLDKATNTWRVQTTSVTDNTAKQAAELEKVQNYLDQQERAYKNLESIAFVKNGMLDKDSPFGEKALDALKEYNEELQKLQRGEVQYNNDTKRNIDNKREDAKRIIEEQKALRDQEQHAKGVASKYDTSYNTRMSEAFGQKNPITGDFKGAVDSVLAEWRQAIDAIGTSITKDQENVLAQLEQRTKDTIKEQRSKQWGATDFASKDVTGEVKIQANEVEHQLNKLKDMGVVSGDIKDKFEELKNSLSGISDQEGLQKWLEQFREAKAELQIVQDQIKQFQNSAQGMAMNLADSIDNNQLQKLDEMLNNTKMWDFASNKTDMFATSGVGELVNQLEQLRAKYQAVRDEMATGNVSEERYAELQNVLRTLGVQFNDVSNQAKKFQDTLGGAQKLQQFSQKADDLRLKFEQLKQRYADLIKTNPQIAAKFEEMENTLHDIDPNNVDQTAKSLNSLGRAASVAAGETGGLRGALHDAFGGVGDMIARFASAYYIIGKISSAIKSMVSQVREIDTSIVELTKVTTLSGQALDDFVNKAYEVGKGLGRTGKDVIDATTTFSRAGYDLQEATQLAQSALVMSNVGVDIPNMESAASDMISILKAFDLQANESMDIISKLYNVANTQPLDFGNITQMLVTAGGTLAQTNTSIEESMGLLTGAFATLRDTSVANGLIMISQRLRGVKEDGEAIEEAGFMPKLKAAFGEVGVAIEDQNGELRSTYDILNDLAGVWDQLSSKQRQYLGEKAAGNRQVKTLNAIMANWETVQATIQAANEAGDAALEGNEKFLESIEGKITQFQSALQNLARTTIDSDFVKFIVDIGTALVNVTTNAGGLIPVLTTITGLVVALNGAKISKGIHLIGDAFKSLKGTMVGATTAASTFGAVMMGLGLAVGVISTIVSVVKNAKVTFSEMQDKSAKARQEYEEQENKVKSLNEELNNTRKLIEDLENKGHLTIIEQDELNNLKRTNDELDRRIKLEKEKARILEADARRASTDTMSSMLNQSPSDLQEPNVRDLFSSSANLLTSSPADKAKIEKLILQNEELKKQGNTYRDTLNSYMEVIPIYETLLLDAQEELKTITNNDDEYKQKSAFIDYLQGELQNMNSELANAYQAMSEEIGNKGKISGAETTEDKLWNELYDYWGSIGDYLVNRYDSRMQDQANRIFESYGEDVKQIQEIINQYGEISGGQVESQFSNILNEFYKFGWSLDEVVQYINETLSKVGQTETGLSPSDIVENLFINSDIYKELSQAIQEQEKSGAISVATAQSLMEQDVKLAEYLELTANGYRLNTEALYEYIEAQDKEEKLQALKGIQDTTEALEELKSKQDEMDADIYKDQLDSLERELMQYQAIVREIDNATGALARYRAAKKTQDEDAEFTEGKGILKDLKENYKAGRIGSDDFQSAMDFFLGDGWEDRFDGDLKKAYKEAEEIGTRYFGQNDDRKGAVNFGKDLEKKGFAYTDKETGKLTLNEGVTIEQIAEDFGMAEDAVKSLFGLLNVYGGNFTFPEIITQDDIEKIQQYNELQEAQQKLTEQEEQQRKKLAELEEEGASEDKIEAAQKDLEATQKAQQAAQEALDEYANQPDVNLEGMSLADAQERLQHLSDLINAINDAGIDVPTYLTGQYEETGNYIRQLQEAEDDSHIIETGADTGEVTEAQTVLDGYGRRVEEISEDGEVTTTVYADTKPADSNLRQYGETADEETRDRESNIDTNADQARMDAESYGETADDVTEDRDSNINPIVPVDGIAEAQKALDNLANPDGNPRKARYEVEVDDPETYGQLPPKKEEAPPETPPTSRGTLPSLPPNKYTKADLVSDIQFPTEDDWNRQTLEKKMKGLNNLVESLDYLENPDLSNPSHEAMLKYHQERLAQYFGQGEPDMSGLSEKDKEEFLNSYNKLLQEYKNILAGNDTETAAGLEEIGSAAKEWAVGVFSTIKDAVINAAEENTEESNTELPSENNGPDIPFPSEDYNWGEQDALQVPIEAENPEQVVEEVQEATKDNPVEVQTTTAPTPEPIPTPAPEININKGDIANIGSAVDTLTAQAENIGATDSKIQELKQSYLELVAAYDKLSQAQSGNVSGNVEEAIQQSTSAFENSAAAFSQAYNDLETEVTTVQTISVDANTDKALQKIKDLAKTKITVSVDITPSNGYAKGTRGAKPGIAMVDDGGGAELIEHVNRGTFELGTDDGPRFTTLDKGDVVHTAKETKRILSRLGKIGSFFRDGWNKGKSLIGKAYATGVEGSIDWASLLAGLTDKGNGKGKGKGKGKGLSAKKLKKWLEKLFDWAEIKLKRLETITNTWLLSASEAIGYIAKNKDLDNALASIQDQIKATADAYQLYLDQAEQVAEKAGLSQDIIDKIKNGDIAIDEYDKDMQEKIKAYQEWYDKAMDCVDALQDLHDQQQDLAKQKLENIITHYNNRINRLDNIVKQRNAEIDLADAQGREKQASDYNKSIDATNKKLNELVAQRDALERELADLVARGLIKEESDVWYEYKSKLDDTDKSIVDTKKAIIDLYDTANEVKLTKLAYQLDALSSAADRVNDAIQLHNAQGNEETADTYEKLIKNGMEQIKILELENEEYRRQQKGLDVLSDKYQDLEKKIQDNISSINGMKVSQEGWNDAATDLKIEQINKYKDSLNKVNEQYERQKNLQEAIEDLQKAQSQRTRRVFHEGEGFVYQADENELLNAQKNLEDLLQDQLMDRLDDLIDALEESKSDYNVYDANGNLLGTQYFNPNLDNLAQLLGDYYDKSLNDDMFADIRKAVYDITGGNGVNPIVFNMNDMNISEVNSADDLARAIVSQLPNALLQVINRK